MILTMTNFLLINDILNSLESLSFTSIFFPLYSFFSIVLHELVIAQGQLWMCFYGGHTYYIHTSVLY